MVDTLKSKYASTSGDGGLKMLATFFLGMSSVSQETWVAWMLAQVLMRREETGRTWGAGELRAEVRLRESRPRVHAGKVTWNGPSRPRRACGDGDRGRGGHRGLEMGRESPTGKLRGAGTWPGSQSL